MAQKNTLFDTVIAAIARQIEVDVIFSFDQWYRKQVLSLAEDIMRTQEQAA